MQSSLVRDPQNLPSGSSWGPKECRAYQRLLSGLRHHISCGHQVRIMTLTSVPGTCWRDLNGWFQVLRKRVTRAYGAMEYWKLRAFEGPGAGVLHVLYVGPWVPQSWLSRAWADITGAPIVYIQQLKNRAGSKRIARYMISNYMMHHDVFRQSWSWGWLFYGFVGWWYKMKKVNNGHIKDAVKAWTRCISNRDPKKMLRIYFGEYYKQARFKKRGPWDPSVVIPGSCHVQPL